MGTSCAIGMKLADGSINAIRCNHDGYIAGAGLILRDWYLKTVKVIALLELGENLAACVTYHRDRGKAIRPPIKFDSIENYQRVGKSAMAADYLYLFSEGAWSVYGLYYEPEWLKLEIKK